MNARLRSASGALLMLLIIPIVAGLLACMPVPIGDPERSRVDPWFHGYWFLEEDGVIDGLYLFAPWDKRTWVLTGIEVEAGPDADLEDFEFDSAEELFALLREHGVGDHGITASATIVYKAWTTKLAGQPFMTWQGAAGSRDGGDFVPEFWWAWKYEIQDDNTVHLRIVNTDHDAFDDIVKPDNYAGDDYHVRMRKTWERAIKKNIDDEDIYSEEYLVLRRVPPDMIELVEDLYHEFVAFQ